MFPSFFILVDVQALNLALSTHIRIFFTQNGFKPIYTIRKNISYKELFERRLSPTEVNDYFSFKIEASYYIIICCKSNELCFNDILFEYNK